MGVVQLPDDLQRMIDREVAEGRASSPAAFLEEAVLHLLGEEEAEAAEIAEVARAGIADVKAGRYT